MKFNTEALSKKENKPKLTKRLIKNKEQNIFLYNKKVQQNKNILFNKELLKNIKKQNWNSKKQLNQIINEEQNKNNHLLPLIKKKQIIGYRNIKLIKSFLTDYKKIKPRRLTKLTLKQQRQLSRAVKRARILRLFDAKKTIKPKKFLNLEKKLETITILLILKILKLNQFLEDIKTLKILEIKQLLKYLDLLDLLKKKSYTNLIKSIETNNLIKI
uniref:30S ribosomal protein S18 n=1 Tax=Dictyotopsis propagulifera TaxID=670095 RepID=UPI002E79C6BB|nr:30S ribosomal protein S18 [Dictyotopsis propagulifera]WAM63178.1 30S ribosomal protein S18 [Dictyotopsis propagulifera]